MAALASDWRRHFYYSSETAERNSTKLDRKQCLNVLYQVCYFRADRKNKMAVLDSDWLRHFGLLLWNRWTEFNETWQEARSQRPLPSLCFSDWLEKQDGRPGLWLAETFSNFSSETAEQNLAKLDRKQDLIVLYQVCVFQADRKNKMAALASDWLRHFLLLLWNRWTEFNKTWQEARSQRPLTRGVFFRMIGKTRWPLWSLIGWGFSTSPLKPLNEIQRNLTGKQDLNVLYQVCVFRADWKNKMAARPLIGWDMFYFSSKSAIGDSRNLERKQVSYRPEKQKLCRGRIYLTLCQVLFNSILWFQRRSRKYLSQWKPRLDILFFPVGSKKHKASRRRSDLASSLVSLNSFLWFQRRSRTCFSKSEAEAVILFFWPAWTT